LALFVIFAREQEDSLFTKDSLKDSKTCESFGDWIKKQKYQKSTHTLVTVNLKIRSEIATDMGLFRQLVPQAAGLFLYMKFPAEFFELFHTQKLCFRQFLLQVFFYLLEESFLYIFKTQTLRSGSSSL
jgi:hypothetical protein